LLIPDVRQPKAFELIYKNDSTVNVVTACQTCLQIPCAVGPLLTEFDFPFFADFTVAVSIRDVQRNPLSLGRVYLPSYCNGLKKPASAIDFDRETCLGQVGFTYNLQRSKRPALAIDSELTCQFTSRIRQRLF
jgi:hypothetical protein